MQQLFRLLIFLIQPHMFRATNSPILRSTFLLSVQLFVQCTDTAADWCHRWAGTSVSSQPWHRSAAVSVHCTKSCIYSQKMLLRMDEFVARTCGAELKRLINGKVVASCWLFTSLYLTDCYFIDCAIACSRDARRLTVCLSVISRSRQADAENFTFWFCHSVFLDFAC